MTDPKISTHELLPLRVAGHDHHYGPQMVRILTAVILHGERLWSHFPKLRAGEPSTPPCKDDLILHPSSLELEAVAVTSGKGQTRKRDGDLGNFTDTEAAGKRLNQYFVAATSIWPQAEYLTPFQLLYAAVNQVGDASKPVVTSGQTADHHLTADIGSLPEKERTEIKNLLCLMRELYYLGRPTAVRPPKTPIAVHGRAIHLAPSPIPFSDQDPVVDLGSDLEDEQRYLQPEHAMHTMALGATGSGKTLSCMVRQLQAHLSYRLSDGTQGAALVVDPKKELAQITQAHLTHIGEEERLFVVGKHGRLRLFSESSPLSLKDRVTMLMDALDVNPSNRNDTGPWIQKSLALLMGLAHAHAVVYNHSGQNLFAQLMEAAGRPSSHEQGYWFGVRDIVRLLQEGVASARWVHQRLMTLTAALQLAADERSAFQFLARYVSMDEEGSNQLSYVTGGLEGALTHLCDAGLAAWLDLSPAPEAQGDARLYDVATLIANCRVIIFQPDDSPTGDLGTRLLKTQFYRSAMERRNMLQPILFLCDEFQRFITCDRESGEASLLDRCRAYRITAVLATQSITALYDALAKRRDGGDPKYAVDSILSNIAHIFYFRTLDTHSLHTLKASLPSAMPSGWRHPLELLPLSALRVGEAYYVSSQGRWGRMQFRPAALSRTMTGPDEATPRRGQTAV